MAVFKAFTAIRPLPAYASQVAALPYDVMNSAEAAEAVKGNPYSFLHVDKAEIDLPAGTDLGLAQEARDMTVNEVLEDFAKDRPCDDKVLEDIIKDMDLDVDLEEVTEEFEKEVDKELQDDFYDPDYEDEGFEHYYRSYDDDGNLIRTTKYDYADHEVN